jgi:FkbM family methyltransferase
LAEEAYHLFVHNNSALSENLPVTKINKNGKEFYVVVSSHLDFWLQVANGNWEPNTFRIFDRFISKDTTFIDIGAFVGSTVFYAAQLAKMAYAFEPDPLAFKELLLNFRANKQFEWMSRLSVYEKAVALRSGKILLGSQDKGGDSGSSVLFSDRSVKWDVEAVSLDEFLESKKVQGKVFIKMDIEGGEYELIPQLRKVFLKYDVVLFLSIHHYILAGSIKKGNKFLARILFVYRHFRLVRALPFKYCYSNTGRRKNLYRGLIKAFFKGKFINEVVATNVPF